MANPEHHEILKQGVAVWNQWRDEHPKIIPNLFIAKLNDIDLHGANLRDAEIRGANLFAANLRYADLRSANLSNADLRDADLRDADLCKANLSNANLKYGDLSHANFSGADLSDTDLSSTQLYKANLSYAKLTQASLMNANITEADLKSANLSHNADLSGAILTRSNLSGAQLRHANLNRVDLSYTNLTGADLRSVTLRDANLHNANLDRANLSWSDLGSVNLMGANLSKANVSRSFLYGSKLVGTYLSKAIFHNVNMFRTILADLDLQDVIGLETVEHRGPSEISLSTIYRSEGKIPKVFLHGCGMSETFIAQIPALVTALEPIQFYSCFISYSSKDQAFAERLYADLQNKGVRCWFAPEDIKIGDKFRTRIDESIRVYDKLLLVLSENSVSSQWVEKEVETAMEREGEQHKTMLFPVRLDNSVNEIKVGWPADIRRTRHIGDFTRWKEHDSYQKAFDRLLRDLKAEEKQS
jgi:uncharacterized protein YjbI with pentapeptide repeats